MPLTPAEKQRRYRQRKAGVLHPATKPTCSGCGAGRGSAHGDLCRICWRRSSEGKQVLARQQRERRASRRGPS